MNGITLFTNCDASVTLYISPPRPSFSKRPHVLMIMLHGENLATIISFITLFYGFINHLSALSGLSRLVI